MTRACLIIGLAILFLVASENVWRPAKACVYTPCEVTR